MSDDTRPIPAQTGDGAEAPTGRQRRAPGLGIEVAGLTDKGRVRPGNEDNLTHESPGSPQARARGTLLVVSDGMGGHAAGEVASQIAVDTVRATYYQQRGVPIGDAVREAIAVANSAIYAAAQRDRERAGMGCTIVALVVHGAEVTIGHVGDSRAYLIRGGQAVQLTNDHSWVAMQVQEGILTPEQAEHHPNRSVLMRALGRQPSVDVDISHRTLQAGDVLLLCSDGLTGMVSDAEIADYASRVPTSQLPRQLVDLANQRGAPDNVTVLVGTITGTPTPAQAASATATTIAAAPPDARTPRMDVPAGDSPTDRNLQRPQPAAAPQGSPAMPPGPRPGTPIVVSRTSATPGAPPVVARPGKGRWIAGAVAAFGLATALLLLSISQLTRDGSPASTSPGTPTAVTAPAGTPKPVATIPPPVSTVLPGLVEPTRAATVTPPPPTAAVTPTQASAPATRPASAASPAISATSIVAPLLPLIPTLESILVTPTPTPDGEGASSDTPSTSAETPPTSPGAQPVPPDGNAGGAAPGTTDPSAEEPAPADQPVPPAAQPPPPPESAPAAQPKPGFQLPPGISIPPVRRRDDD
ncbi:MAG: Stp1/IreP family PP2C-type Ser/Thr phosphatase [Chloroflexota bacterium]